MATKNLPSVSIVIPTYNNAATLEECLRYLTQQDYPKSKIEIIIVDGFSKDNSLKIAKNYTGKVYMNPDKVEEVGRVIGIEKSSGDVLGFVDADNFLIDKKFLIKVVRPFMEYQDVCVSEPLFYESRITDDKITQYISLIGGDDPVSIYLGVYDRWCFFKGSWTDSRYSIKEGNDSYEVIQFKDENVPPLGANSSFIRKKVLLRIKYEKFLHTDIIAEIFKNKKNLYAKVHCGVIHKQDGSIKTFLMKKARRARRFKGEEFERKYYFKVNEAKLLILIVKSLLILPLFIDSLIGYKNKKNINWVFHPLITILTLFIYSYYSIRKILWR
ncbi:MAG: putative glycosyltransferase EpsJ [Microgenomates group bacterium ADurb.Bin219]|nr:MAG: putative glycosyltransferase EpsJ [Microgenomates group bacterium ADurb.Bin219]